MHDVDVGGASHKPNPNAHRTQNVQCLAKHEFCVKKQENEVYGLEHGQHPDALDFYVLEGGAGEEHADLIAPIKYSKILPYHNLIGPFWIQNRHLFANPVSKAGDDGVLEKVDGHQVEDKFIGFGNYASSGGEV